MDFFFFDHELIKQLKCIFKKEKPEIIHSHFDGYDVYAVLANNVGAEIIWHQHNPRVLMPDLLRRSYQKITLFRHYNIHGNSVHLIILNEQAKEDIVEFGYRGDFYLLPNGIQIDRISYSEKIAHDTPIFLNFGGRADHKGLDILLKAIKTLIENKYDFTVHITNGVDTESFINTFFKEIFLNKSKLYLRLRTFPICFEMLIGLFLLVEERLFLMQSLKLCFQVHLSYLLLYLVWSGLVIKQQLFPVPTEDPESLAEKMADIIEGRIRMSSDDLIASRRFIVDNYSVELWANKLIGYYDSLLRK